MCRSCSSRERSLNEGRDVRAGSRAPAWLEARDELGPFRDAAVRLLAAEAPSLESFPRGAPALAWLARKIDEAAAHEMSAQEEAAFIDGAGSLLAAILVDHVGLGAHVERDGVHRLRLGTHGYFNPFEAIEAALAANSAKSALVAEVARAEAEAAGVGGQGRVALLFEQVLADVRPDLVVDASFEGRLWVRAIEGPEGGSGPIEVEISRIVALSDGQPDATVEAAVRKLVSLLPGSPPSSLDVADARERLLPRVVGPRFEASPGLFRRALPNGVGLCLTLAYEGRARFVRANELEVWGLAEDDAVRIALDNLARRSERARFERVEEADGPVVIARSGDGLDSARLVLPGLVDVLGPELGEPFVAAVPHRDTLLACRADAPRAREAMMMRVSEAHARAPHRISDKPFLVDRRGLRAP